ncbi:MAG TPA: SURF1 family protein [Methylibium sp.]|uniref:SURF1 family protein n=1 Tax=Methylibium sp. TaxID=2067992 RepID=UPI002DB63BB7|nr:SURF1 family protein [Methylibium sp.]HEU4457966.1 SURF1 family protein [Methylibium sp.]
MATMSPRLRRAIVLLAAVAMTALTARLGFWQLGRAQQKEALQSQRETRRGEPPLAAAELARTAQAAAAQHDRRIVLAGRWLPQHAVFLDNRPLEGRAGVLLVMPLELAPGDTVLVQRGWAPRDPVDRSRLPSVPSAPGRVLVEGVVAPPPGRTLALGAEGRGMLRQNLDPETFARETGLPLRPLSIRQDEGPPDDGLVRRWPAPATEVPKHRGYAFQWFALSSLTVALYVWFQLLGPWWRRRRAA